MNRNKKIILGILGGMLVLCLCIVGGGYLAIRNGLKSMAVDNPTQVAAMAKDMVDYQLPNGYKEQYVINFGFMKMLEITDGTKPMTNASRPWFLFAQMPNDPNIDPEEVRLQIELSMERQNQQNFKVHLVGQQKAVIRGQDVTFVVYEGTDENNVSIREMASTTFTGKSGLLICG